MTTGQRIRAARQAAGLTQAQVADEIGCSEPAIRLYELGKRNPSPEVLEKIARSLNVDVQSLTEVEIASTRDALEMLFRMEDACGLVPRGDGSIAVDQKSENASKMSAAIKVWAGMRSKLDSGDISQEEYDSWKGNVGL